MNKSDNIECNYSFEMLYEAAFGKKIPKDHKSKLQKSSQEEINRLVLAWSKKAGWRTDSRKGSDGTMYISFHP